MDPDHLHKHLSQIDGSVSSAELLARQRSLLEFSWKHVPAYAKVSATEVLDKESFVNRFALSQRCRDGDISSLDFIHGSSGSSGVPTHWGRTREDEALVSLRFQQVFESFESRDLSTLVLVVLPMGVWVGGVFSSFCVRSLPQFGFRLTMMTPGNNMADILKILSGPLPRQFKQVCLIGYPPFCKGIVDGALANNIDLAPMRLKFILAGEVFSEEWRSLMMDRCSLSEPTSIVSIYGTADAGVLGCETPLTIYIRREIAKAPREVCDNIFGRDRLPTLVQYDPRHRFFERTEKGEMVFTTMPHSESESSKLGFPAAPLIRYNIGDAGGLYSYGELIEKLEGLGINVPSSLSHYTMPFAFVFGRAFWTKSLYGANVYVENVMSGIEDPIVAPLVTGKFVLSVAETEDVRLKVVVELAVGTAPSAEVENVIRERVLAALLRLNGEYAAYVPAEKQLPLIDLCEYGDGTYFPLGTKHRYIQD